MVDEQAVGLQVFGAAAEGVLERSEVVHVDRHHPVGADGFEQAGHVAGGDRVAGLGLLVLARIGQVRHDGGDRACRGVLESADEEQPRSSCGLTAMPRCWATASPNS